MGFSGSGPALGGSGYVNWGGGWADAEASVRYALDELKRRDSGGRVTISTATKVRRLLFDNPEDKVNGSDVNGDGNDKNPDVDDDKRRSPRCIGLELDTGTEIKASLVVLATGAWTPTLVDLRGRAIATGQVLTYIDLTEAEQAAMGERPVFMNMSRGLFIIPPRDRELKIARHGYGYRNLRKVPKPAMSGDGGGDDGGDGGDVSEEISGTTNNTIEISVPDSTAAVPAEGEEACRALLRDVFSDPEISARPFSKTRVCWYCDTPSGNFLIDWHPDCSHLFVATGGSGHGFKFLPIIGDKIVDAIDGTLAPRLADRWSWTRHDRRHGFDATDDPSRAGRKGMVLAEEGIKRGPAGGEMSSSS